MKAPSARHRPCVRCNIVHTKSVKTTTWCVYVCVCMYVCIYVCVCVCVCVCAERILYSFQFVL